MSELRLAMRVRLRLYKLDGHRPVRCETQREWLDWFSGTPVLDRLVARYEHAGVVVATTFIGVDSRLRDTPRSAPLLFETVVFGGPLLLLSA